MPTVAKNKARDELTMIVDAEKENDFVCPSCGKDVSYVKGHQRDDGWCREHFRYYKCGCYGKKYAGSAGGGGGPGESLHHRMRKKQALNYATNRFEAATHGTEVPIGDKQADAVLEFETPSDEYGLGFVIEYQHKNETKDIEAVETVYARHGYTTLWLWESEFRELDDNRPVVELFRGRTCKPFPKGVPEMSDWAQDSEMAESHLRELRQDHFSRVDVTIHREWYVRQSSRSFRSTDWLQLFEFSDGRNRSYIDWKTYKQEQHVEATIYRSWGMPPGYSALTTRDVEPPGNVHDDVQCFNCGSHIYYKEARPHCETCGRLFDLQWNVDTGRISVNSYNYLRSKFNGDTG
jgi:endogenous inhibitor of DNA gyrase (YacG/DUF329 family)